MWTPFLTLVFVVAVFGAPAKKEAVEEEETRPYEGHKLVSVTAKTAKDVEILRLLQDGGQYMVDFFTHPHLGQVQIRIPPKDFANVWSLLTFSGLQPIVAVENIQTFVDADAEERKTRRAAGRCTSHTKCYLTLAEIEAFVNALQQEFPDRVRRLTSEVVTTGGNKMWAVQISKDFSTKRPVVIVEALTHAREWVVGSVALDLMDRLARLYDIDGDVTMMLDYYDWYIVPVHNPDGYSYTHTNDRFWRKNRNRISGCFFGVGVDLNRNWGSNFGGVGSSSSCSSDTYHGPGPFSEQETGYLRDLLYKTEDVKMFLSLHSFSQMIFIPYGYDMRLDYSDKNLLHEFAQNAATDIRAVNGRVFQVGTPGDLLYEASGGAYDWFRDNGVQFSFTYELRPDGSHGIQGFALPESEIEAAQKETWASFVSFTKNTIDFAKTQ